MKEGDIVNEYVLICPYFGHLPDNFPLWLNSCMYNDKINFLIFTDDNRSFKAPHNVKINHMELDELQRLIKVKFPFVRFDISPYKLCDYKPTYGYLFSDYISGYKYWGNCDIDLIYGDLIKFLPTQTYDKISNLGHTTFYRNESKINTAFMESSEDTLTYKEILASDANFGFDEIGSYGIKHIFNRNKYSVYPLEKYIADISPNNSNLRLSHYDSIKDCFHQDNKDSIISFEKGHIFSWYLSTENKIKKTEFAYVHFQKRKMIDYRTQKNDEYFLIGPHGFYDYQKVSIDLFTLFHGLNIDSELLHWKFKALKNRLKREVAIRKLMKGRK